MAYNSIILSSAHWKSTNSGANSYLNEVTESRKVVEKVAEYIRKIGCKVSVFHDNTSTNQDKNLATIVNYHNSKSGDIDISIHFNAASKTTLPRGTEVYGYSSAMSGVGGSLSAAVANSGGFKNRGFKAKDFYFLRKTKKKALLIEVCFVDSKADADLYRKNFDKICKAIAENLTGKKVPVTTPTPSTSINQSPTFSSNGSGTYQVVCNGLNIRSDAGTSNKIVGTLAKGHKFNAIGSKSGWLKIANGKYVSGHSAYVKRI